MLATSTRCTEDGEQAGQSPAALSHAVRRRLLRPAGSAALPALPERWFHYVIELRCRRPKGLADGAHLAGRLRGALGQALMRAAAHDDGAAAALAALFGQGVRLSGRLEIPHPFVLHVGTAGEELVAKLTLIGFATDLLEPVLEGLLAGAARGIGPGAGGPPLTVLSWRTEVCERLFAPERARLALLEFETPYASRSGRWVMGTTANLMARLAQRVSLLARWQDCRAEADWGALNEGAGRLRFHDRDLRPRRWYRYSARQGRRIPMLGLAGTLLLEGDLTPYLPLLAIGETCHVGSHASLGMGRYRLRVMA